MDLKRPRLEDEPMAETPRGDPYCAPDFTKLQSLFVLVYLHPEYLTYPSTIAINIYDQISFDGGKWHGQAIFEEDWFWGGRYTLWFYNHTYSYEWVEHFFYQIRGTHSYLHVSPINSRYNCMLIPQPEVLYRSQKAD